MQKRKISKSKIVHQDRFGNALLVDKVTVCNTLDFLSARPELALEFAKLKKKFQLLVKVFPLKKSQDNRFFQLGSIGIPSCNRMTQEVLDAVLSIVQQVRQICLELRDKFKGWKEELAELLSETRIYFAQVESYLDDFHLLYKVCKSIIRQQGFFLARTKFHTNMARHGELMQKQSKLKDVCAKLKADVYLTLDVVQAVERLSGLLAMIHGYICGITAKEDLKCNVETMFNSKHLCAEHAHFKIKMAYQHVVKEMNTPPNASEILVNATAIVRELKNLDEQYALADEVLDEDYRECLFRVQKWIHEYIVEHEEELGEGIVTD